MTQLRDVLKNAGYAALSRLTPLSQWVKDLPCPIHDHEGQTATSGPFNIITPFEGEQYLDGSWICTECEKGVDNFLEVDGTRTEHVASGMADQLASILSAKLGQEVPLPMPPDVINDGEEIIWQLDTGSPRYRYWCGARWMPLHKDAVIRRLRDLGYSTASARSRRFLVPIAVSEVFEPRDESRVIRRDEKVYLNTYLPLQMQPEAGEFPTIEKCLRFLVDGDDAAFEYVLDWLAAPLKSICAGDGSHRNLSALVFYGAQSTGKGMMFGGGGVMERIYGSDYHTEIGQKDIEDTFEIGPILTGRCFFLCLNEVAVSGARSEKVLNKLKRYVTESKLSLRDMHKVSRQSGPGEIGFNMVLMSNDREPIRLEETDRRYSCFSQYKPLPLDLKNQLIAQKMAGWPEAAAFFSHLLRRHVGRDLTVPFENEARSSLMESSMPSQVKFANLIKEDGLGYVFRLWMEEKNAFKNDTDYICYTSDAGVFVPNTTLSRIYQHWCKADGTRMAVRSLALKRAILDIVDGACEYHGRIYQGTTTGNRCRGLAGFVMDVEKMQEPVSDNIISFN